MHAASRPHGMGGIPQVREQSLRTACGGDVDQIHLVHCGVASLVERVECDDGARPVPVGFVHLRVRPRNE